MAFYDKPVIQGFLFIVALFPCQYLSDGHFNADSAVFFVAVFYCDRCFALNQSMNDTEIIDRRDCFIFRTVQKVAIAQGRIDCYLDLFQFVLFHDKTVFCDRQCFNSPFLIVQRIIDMQPIGMIFLFVIMYLGNKKRTTIG